MPCCTMASVRVSMEEVASSRIMHRRIGHGCTRDGQQLPLALGETGAVAGEHGIVPIGQQADKAVGIGQLWPPHTLPRRWQSSLPYRMFSRMVPVKRLSILQHDAQAAAQVGLLDLVDVDAVIANLAVGNIVEPVDQVGDRGLAGTGGAYKGDLLAGFGIEADVVQDDLVRRL